MKTPHCTRFCGRWRGRHYHPGTVRNRRYKHYSHSGLRKNTIAERGEMYEKRRVRGSVAQ